MQKVKPAKQQTAAANVADIECLQDYYCQTKQ